MQVTAFVSLVAASLAAASHHEHRHARVHEKKEIVNEIVTITDWVTVPAAGGSNSLSARVFHTRSRNVRAEARTAIPTTIVTQVKPTQSSQPASRDNGNGKGGSKRGLAYNEASLLKRFLDSGTKVSWIYNWGQTDDSGSGLEFCPMLWGLKLDFAETWPQNAQKAVDAGSACLFSFNEPDHPTQANMAPDLAAKKHAELMNPFEGKARIGAPAITNSGEPGQGVEWLRNWVKACDGECVFDFVNIHIYGFDTAAFLDHLIRVNEEFEKPVWITEFAFAGSDKEIDDQLGFVIDQMENNKTFSFVERFSYFMVQEGVLVKGDSMTTYGKTFAYGA